jgi:hypothetical protein
MRTFLYAALLAGMALVGWHPVWADDQAETQAILQRGIKALGGEERLSKFKAATWKGKGKFYDQHGQNAVEYTGEWALQPPRQFRGSITVVHEGMIHTEIRVLNGDKDWTRRDDGDTEEIDLRTATQDQRQMYEWLAETLLPLRNKDLKLAPLGASKVGDHAAVGLKQTKKDGREFHYFFDRESSLLLKSEFRVKDRETDKEVTEEMLYSDYKEVDGIKQAMKLIGKHDGKIVLEQEITDFKPQEKLDDKVFAKP